MLAAKISAHVHAATGTSLELGWAPAFSLLGARPGALWVVQRQMLNFHLCEGIDAPSISEQITATLANSSAAVIESFMTRILKETGTVSRAEFHEVLHALGIEAVPESCIDEVFTQWDDKHAGKLGLVFLRKALLESAAGEELRILRRQFTKQGLRVASLFRELDADSNGKLTREEFHLVGPRLATPRRALSAEQLDVVFDCVDSDGALKSFATSALRFSSLAPPLGLHPPRHDPAIAYTPSACVELPVCVLRTVLQVVELSHSKSSTRCCVEI